MVRRFLWLLNCLLLVPAVAQLGSYHEGISTTAQKLDSITLLLNRDFSKQKAEFSNGLGMALIEIPTGTIEKWEVDKNNPSHLVWEHKNGTPRIVQYLGYPGNYGAIAATNMLRTKGGDGDALDVLVLGPPLPRGSWHMVRPIGILYMHDNGEKDDKIIAVIPEMPPFGGLMDIEQLDSQFPGVSSIIKTWFKHYKGPESSIQIQGFGKDRDAWKAIDAGLLKSSEKE